MKRLFFRYALIVTIAVALAYSFWHKGVRSPVKSCLGQTEAARRGGDFWSTFPAHFVDKYNPLLREKTIVKDWYKGEDWGYGPVQHLITLPLTFSGSIRAVAWAWLAVSYIFLALGLFFLIKTFDGAPFTLKAMVAFMWLGFWPLYPAIEEGVIEVFELFMIILSLYFLCRKRDSLAGVAAGIAAMAKFLPLIFLAYFLIKGKFKAFFAMLGVVLLIAIATQFTLGWQNSEMLRRFITEIKEGKYDYTYWRSQTVPSAVERIFSTTDYSTSQIYYPKVAGSARLVKWAVVSSISLVGLMAFLTLAAPRNKRKDIGIEYGIVSVLMVLMSTHGEHYYLIFCLIGYSFALRRVYREKDRFGALILALSYLLAGYITQMREFDMILLPKYTDINREVFFCFLSFPAYGAVLLFLLLCRFQFFPLTKK